MVIGSDGQHAKVQVLIVKSLFGVCTCASSVLKVSYSTCIKPACFPCKISKTLHADFSAILRCPQELVFKEPVDVPNILRRIEIQGI